MCFVAKYKYVNIIGLLVAFSFFVSCAEKEEVSDVFIDGKAQIALQLPLIESAGTSQPSIDGESVIKNISLLIFDSATGAKELYIRLDIPYTTSSSSSIGDVLGFEGMSNPVMILDLQKRMRYNTQIFGNAAFTFHLAEGLDLKTQLGIDSHSKTYRGYSSIGLNNISMPNGWAEYQNWNTLYWQEETYLTYNKVFGDHRVNAMAGLSWQERTQKWNKSRTEGFSDDFFEDHIKSGNL